MTIVNGNEMRARNVEDDEVLRARLRTWTPRARMAKLVTISKVLESVLVEKFAIPFLQRKLILIR